MEICKTSSQKLTGEYTAMNNYIKFVFELYILEGMKYLLPSGVVKIPDFVGT